MATNITKTEAKRHHLPPNRNTLHIYEVELPKKKSPQSNPAFAYQFTGNRGTCEKITQKFNH